MSAFEEIIGNQQVIKNLTSAIENKRVSHAYILSGPYGIGKMLMAESFALELQCENRQGKACGVCSACKSTKSKNNPDIIYVVPKKTKAIGADDIREQVLRQVEIKQYKYKYKIFIIENADKMTVAAQNAFLKTLEEPPGYAIFLLLAENPELFLPTVFSRCVMIRLRPLGTSLVKEYLIEKNKTEKDEAVFFAEYSAGSIGKAIKLSTDEDFISMRNDIIDRLYNIGNTELWQILCWGRELEKYKESFFECLDIAELWFRDVLAAKKLKDSKYIIQKDKEQKIFSQAKNTDFLLLEKSFKAVCLARRQLEQNGSFQLIVENMLMTIKGV